MTDAPQVEPIDDDLLHSETLEGEPVDDEKTASAVDIAEAVTPLTFEALGLRHRVEVQASLVPWKLRRRLRSRGQSLLLQAARELGYQAPEEGEKSDPDLELAVQKRVAELATDDEQFQEMWAEAALAAVVRDNNGRLRISIPQLRGGATPRALIQSEAGAAFLQEMKGWFSP